MTQYRAVLIDPGRPTPDRPVQIISNSVHDVDDWAAEVLGGGTQLQGEAKIQVSDRARIMVYVTTEKLAAIYTAEEARRIRDEKLKRKREA